MNLEASVHSVASVSMESGAVLLDDVVRFIRRFVVLSPAQADATALWVAHSHAIEAADCSPYLWITSAVPRSGKTRLLDDVLGLLVREPIPTANISDAALFRVIAERKPTLLLDEVDAIFGPKARDREDFRGMLCAGYRRGAQTHRMGGANMRELQTFPVFCCKALAGVGEALPDTIKDRAIRIRLERRTREERVDRLRRRVLAPEGEMLRDRLADWTEPQLDELHHAWPELPDELDDRAQDIWEPLFALADLAGGDWPERARTAALVLSGNGEREDDSLGARMLADIRTVFAASGADRFRTADLLAELCKVEESPWGDWFGKTLTPQGLSKLLQPFRIKTMPIWVEGEKARGYKVTQFADAFSRVLGGRDGRDGRSVLAPGEAPTGPTAPTTLEDGDGTDRPFPLLGELDYLDFVAARHREGHLTTAEALQQERLHRQIRRQPA